MRRDLDFPPWGNSRRAPRAPGLAEGGGGGARPINEIGARKTLECKSFLHMFFCKIIQIIQHDSCEISILRNSHIFKLRVNRPVARVYRGVCPRMEPACGSVTSLGDSIMANRTILYTHHVRARILQSHHGGGGGGNKKSRLLLKQNKIEYGVTQPTQSGEGTGGVIPSTWQGTGLHNAANREQRL